MPSNPVRPDLEQLRKQAKELRRAAVAGDATARVRFLASHPVFAKRPDTFNPAKVVLRDAQVVLAREHGYAGWKDLVAASSP